MSEEMNVAYDQEAELVRLSAENIALKLKVEKLTKKQKRADYKKAITDWWWYHGDSIKIISFIVILGIIFSCVVYQLQLDYIWHNMKHRFIVFAIDQVTK